MELALFLNPSQRLLSQNLGGSMTLWYSLRCDFIECVISDHSCLLLMISKEKLLMVNDQTGALTTLKP